MLTDAERGGGVNGRRCPSWQPAGAAAHHGHRVTQHLLEQAGGAWRTERSDTTCITMPR